MRPMQRNRGAPTNRGIAPPCATPGTRRLHRISPIAATTARSKNIFASRVHLFRLILKEPAFAKASAGVSTCPPEPAGAKAEGWGGHRSRGKNSRDRQNTVHEVGYSRLCVF